jgi:hypothetical protein
VKVGDVVAIKDEWRIFEFYYGLGVITLIDEEVDGRAVWKTCRVQWNEDFLFHTEDQLELISEA